MKTPPNSFREPLCATVYSASKDGIATKVNIKAKIMVASHKVATEETKGCISVSPNFVKRARLTEQLPIQCPLNTAQVRNKFYFSDCHYGFRNHHNGKLFNLDNIA